MIFVVGEKMNKEEKIQKIIDDVKNTYSKKHSELYKIYNERGEGAARTAAGNLTESILETIIKGINEYFNLKIQSKIGTQDYLQIKNFENKSHIICKNIQVDRHLILDGKRIAFIENKTYLDACYYDRALSDFKKIIISLSQSNIDISKIKFIVLTGQNAMSENKKNFLNYMFKLETESILKYKNNTGIVNNINLKIFYFLKNKKRNSKKPIYNNYFSLDEDEIKKIIQELIC